MKTIMFGNGLNLLNGYSTWEDLLVRIDDKADRAKIPNTLQYEAEILPTPLSQTYLVTIDGKMVTQDGKAVKSRWERHSIRFSLNIQFENN